MKLKSSKDVSGFTEDIINAIHEPLIVLDKDLRVVKANQLYYDFFNVTSTETVGTLILGVGNHQWNIPELKKLLEAVLLEKISVDNYEVEYEFPIIGKRIMLFNARKIKCQSGIEQLIVVLIKDITQFKHIEKENRERERKLQNDYYYIRSLFEASLDPLLTINSNGKITDANSATETVIGVSLNTLIGSDFSSYFTEPYKARIVYQKIFEQGFVIGYPLTIHHSSNKLIDVLFNASVYRDDKNKILGIFATAHDITERNKAEKEIKLMNEQLVLLNSEKDRFFSIIAHDLKSPFQGLLGLTDIMVEEGSEYSAKEWVQIGNDLHQLASNLFNLLKNLLEWAQMQKGSIPYQPKEFLLSDLIKEIVGTLTKRCEQKRILLINSVTEPIYVNADENMTKSVLLNLISNAVKFTYPDGIVSITANKTVNKMIEVSISDTGVGMQTSYINKLFKIGEKIGTIGTEGELSTGLGLLLCKEFVEKQGGHINVKSEIGKGSIFSFTIPTSQQNIKEN